MVPQQLKSRIIICCDQLLRRSRRICGWLFCGMVFGLVHGYLVHVVTISDEAGHMAEVSISVNKASYDEELLAKRLIFGALLGAIGGGVLEQYLCIKPKSEVGKEEAR